MIYVPGLTPDSPPRIVAAIVPADDPIMRFMRQYDPDHVEVRYFATMHLSDGRADAREWGQGLNFPVGLGPCEVGMPRLRLDEAAMCPSCGGDVRRCACALSITSPPTDAPLTRTGVATLTRRCHNASTQATNRRHRRAKGSKCSSS